MVLRNSLLEIIFGVIALFLISNANAQLTASQENCLVQQPPSDAGENVAHGLNLKVFPMAHKIPQEYSGCQIAWQQEQNGWTIFVRFHFENGQVVAISSLEMECKYSNGLLTQGSSDECPPDPPSAMLSMARECFNDAKDGGGSMAEKCSFGRKPKKGHTG
ncbi:hypothetical protein ACXZ1M_25565 [Duganella sp. PWIR1]